MTRFGLLSRSDGKTSRMTIYDDRPLEEHVKAWEAAHAASGAADPLHGVTIVSFKEMPEAEYNATARSAV